MERNVSNFVGLPGFGISTISGGFHSAGIVPRLLAAVVGSKIRHLVYLKNAWKAQTLIPGTCQGISVLHLQRTKQRFLGRVRSAYVLCLRNRDGFS